jgi:hypothetical protein
MSQLERSDDFEASLRAQIQAALLVLHTAMPVQVTGYDPSNNTATLQPLIKQRIPLPDGTFMWVKLPQLIFCPVIMLAGGLGSFSWCAPPQIGSEGLAIFSNRAIDNWWAAGPAAGNDPTRFPIELRHHDLSDGFVIVGATSKPNTIPGITPNAQLRSADGTVYLDFSLAGITLAAPVFTINSPLIALNGVLSTTAIPAAGTTASTFSIPIIIGGVPYYIRLSLAP